MIEPVPQANAQADESMLTLTAPEAVEAATLPRTEQAGSPARFVFTVPEGRDPVAVAAKIAAVFAPLGGRVDALSPHAPRDLALTLPGRLMGAPARAFAAAHVLETTFDLPVVEPEIFHSVMPVDVGAEDDLTIIEGLERLPPGCWVDPEPQLEATKDWALDRMRVREAWSYAESRRRPSKGAGIVIAQPDTGVTDHPELTGVDRAGAFNLLDGANPSDARDPLDYEGNPGHGTSTASVVVSPDTGEVVGSAPAARHLPIRAIENVVRLSQAKIAEAIDRAVHAGAHVITMSLGGVYSFALQRAVARAVQADVIVLAAAGNCVRVVVWPARFEDCIAVAGTNSGDGLWKGSCRGPDVDISAPAQNVYRASVGATPVSQGQGTSFAVAMTAGVAACWLAYHGRAQLIAEARLRGETLQVMFKRLLKATARRPKGEWDSFSMGPGIVDALALLKADLDASRETEGPVIESPPSPADRSIRGFALETLGAEALAGVDWVRHGQELSLAVLRARTIDPDHALESGLGSRDAVPAISPALRAALTPDLRERLGVAQPTRDDDGPAGPATPPPSPAVHKPQPESILVAGVKPERVQRQRRILAARHLRETSALEGAINESSLPPDAPVPDAQDVLHNIDGVMRQMPESEIGDPQAFRQALEVLYRHGEPALRKIADVGAGPAHGVTPDEVSALEAVVIADGSRPSFLLKNGRPPTSHPFLKDWADDVATFSDHVHQAAQAIARVQPTGGHASLFLGTASLVDRGQMLALTNYHVLDDARVKLGIPMTQSGQTVTVHGGLEIDFVGEADNLATNRFKIVEAMLPNGYGRGFGHLDAAVLRIEPANDRSELPPAAVPLSAEAGYVTGEADRLMSLCTIGYPGRPPKESGTTGEVDWSFITAALFGNRFGFKRMAPGKFSKSLGSDDRDGLEIVFSHDATTFGGSSGTLVLAWRDKGPPAFGLHFAGTLSKANHAISLGKSAEALRAVGVPVI